MESSKLTFNKLFITLFLFTLVPEVYSESPYKKTFYNSFINREMYKWGNVINTIENGKPMTTVDQKLELINYYYGYIGYLIGKKQYDTASPMINKGEKLIHQVLQVSPKNATAYAFKGSFLGFRMGMSKFKTFSLSRESLSDINRAYELDPHNVQALIGKGNILYYSPKLFGGDKEEALTYYLRGLRILEKNRDTDQNWVYLNLLTNIALAYDKTDKPGDAKLTCVKILHNEPNYRWVKDILYPRLLEKTK
jgi:tetratricopeptide (TPR) repeat protein